MTKIRNAFSFDVGIEQRSRIEVGEKGTLPDNTARLKPSERALLSQYENPLFRSSLKNSTLLSLKPDIEDMAMLSPANYYRMLESIRRQLEKKKDRKEGSEEAEEIEDLLSVLEDTKGNNDFFNVMKSVLIKS